MVALVALDLVERYTAVGRVLAREAEHPFTDDVARDLGGATAERGRLPGQVSVAEANQVVGAVDHARAAGNRQSGIELELDVSRRGRCE